MILLVRFFLSILKSRLQRRLGPFDEAVLAMRVWPNDLDLNMHMNSGRYVSINDVARVALIARMRMLWKCLSRGWRPIAGATMIRYRRSLLPFEKFEVRTRVLCWDEKWFYFQHRIEKDGELCSAAVVRALIRGKEGNIAPQRLMEMAGFGDVVSPPVPEAIVRWQEALP